MPVMPDDLGDWEQGLSADATPSDVDAAVERHVQACADEVRAAVDALPIDLSLEDRARLVDKALNLMRAQSRTSLEQALRQLRH